MLIIDAWGQQVRLGVNAPRDVPMHRQEVYALIKQLTPVDSNRPQRIRIILTKSKKAR